MYTVLSYVSRPKIQKVISLKTKVKFYCEVKTSIYQYALKSHLELSNYRGSRLYAYIYNLMNVLLSFCLEKKKKVLF